MSVYNVTSHSLLSTRATQLYSDSSSDFEGVVLVAEAALGLDATAFTGDDAEKAKVAVARQVNLILETTEETLLFSMIVRGSRTNAARAGSIVTVDPVAKSIVADLGVDVGTSSGFPVLRSLR